MMMRLILALLPYLIAAQRCNDAVQAAQSSCTSLDYKNPAEKCSSGSCNWALQNMQNICSSSSDPTAMEWTKIAESLLSDLCSPCALSVFGAQSMQCSGSAVCGAQCQPLLCNISSACASSAAINLTYYDATSYSVLTVSYTSSEIEGIWTGYKAQMSSCGCDLAPFTVSAAACSAAISAANFSCATWDATVMAEKCTPGPCQSALTAVASSCRNISNSTIQTLQTLAMSLTVNLCTSCPWAVSQLQGCSAGSSSVASTSSIAGNSSDINIDDNSSNISIAGNGSIVSVTPTTTGGVCALCPQLTCNVLSACGAYLTTTTLPQAVNTTPSGNNEAPAVNATSGNAILQSLDSNAAAALEALAPQLTACPCSATTNAAPAFLTCPAAVLAAKSVCLSLNASFPTEKCQPGACHSALVAVNSSCDNTSSPTEVMWRTTATSLTGNLCTSCSTVLAEAAAFPQCYATEADSSVACNDACQPLLLSIVTNCPPGSVFDVSYYSEGRMVSNYLSQESILSISSVDAVRWASCLPTSGGSASGGSNASSAGGLRSASNDVICSSAFKNAKQTCKTLDDSNIAEKCADGPCRMSLGMMQVACSVQSTPLTANYSELATSLFTNLCEPCAQSLSPYFTASSVCSQATMCSSACSSLSCAVIERCSAADSSYDVTVLNANGLRTTSFTSSQIATTIVAPLSSAAVSCPCSSGSLPSVYVGSSIPTLVDSLTMTKNGTQGTLGIVSGSLSMQGSVLAVWFALGLAFLQ